jgi:hypothetical protein
MPVAAAIAVGVAAVAGGAAGQEKDKVSQSGSQANVSQVLAAPAGADEQKARGIQLDQIDQLQARLSSLESSSTLDNLDKLMAELGQAPSADRISQSNKYADQIYQPRQEQLNQSFQDQTRGFQARAALMGRSSVDPIMAARLAQEQVRQQSSLNAEKGSFAANEAVNAPARQFNNQMGALQGLSNQAISNRQAVYSLGSDFANTQMNFRLATATRTGNSVQNNEQLSGGGFKGFMTGFMAGGAGMAKMVGGGAGGGGGGG